jgi:hypothetical protein
MDDVQFDQNMAMEGIWRWKVYDEHYMYYNKRIITCVEHLNNFKQEYLLHLKIPEVLSISKFYN